MSCPEDRWCTWTDWYLACDTCVSTLWDISRLGEVPWLMMCGETQESIWHLLSDVFQLASLWSVKFNWMVFKIPAVRRGAVGWGPALHAGRWRVRFPMGSLGFLIDLHFQAAVWPWDRLSLWQKWVPEVPEVSSRGKSGRSGGLTNLSRPFADYLEILGASNS
jgi:hypothetical protein